MTFFFLTLSGTFFVIKVKEKLPNLPILKFLQYCAEILAESVKKIIMEKMFPNVKSGIGKPYNHTSYIFVV